MAQVERPQTAADRFARDAQGKSGSVLADCWYFIRHSKKWWLTPVLVILLLFSILIVLTESSAIAPFIYTLF